MTTLQLVMLIASVVTTLIGSLGGIAWFLAGRIKVFETRMVAAIGDLRSEIGYLRGRIDGKARPDF